METKGKITRKPLALTKNSKVKAVLPDVKEHDMPIRARALLKLITPAEEDIRQGRTRAASTFFKKFRRAKLIRTKSAIK